MFYNDLPQLTYFSESDLLEIEELSCGLSHEEVLEYYALTKQDIEAVDTPDLKYFTIAFNRGRTRFKNKAVTNLFSCMTDKNGAAASIAYLRHFGSEWPQDANDDVSSGKKFSFNVTMSNPL